MGIYDREYYRKEGPSYLEALIPSGNVCKWLIGLNILLFIGQLITKPTPDEFRHLRQMNGAEIGERGQASPWGSVSDALILDTAKVSQGQVWRLLTYAFMHSPFT